MICFVAITYSVIAPIINGLSCFTFFLFYQLYKYLFIYTFDQPASGDTGGLFFPKAIQHVFVGLYIQQICLAALFFIAQDSNNNPSAIPEGALMVVLIIFTIFFHIVLNNSYGPLLNYLPLSLAHHANVAESDSGATLSGTAVDGGISPSSSHGEKVGLVPRNGNQPEPYAPATHGPDASGNPATSKVTPSGDVGVNDFYHPASYEPQRVVWIPRDELGLSAGEVRANIDSGVDASDFAAVMNGKGKVDVEGPPPGEE